ncbi:hypothetical protein [Haloglomus litoreum]|uniref:hypothetical protein n=1 Tax=Haloglomus litoreum TaxID=3034026 RepID=UPI0023E8F07F|nr:hypothetical protein [Haloglomus sp. DT116]
MPSTRRALLRSVAAGAAVSPLPGLGRATAAEPRVPTVIGPDGPGVPVSIPRRCQEAYERAYRATRTLADRLADAGSGTDLTVAVTSDADRWCGERRLPRLQVRVTGADHPPVPREFADLPVEVADVARRERGTGGGERSRATGTCADPCNLRNFDPVPGGVFAEGGTTTWVVRLLDTDYLLTANHTLQSGDPGCGDVETSILYQYRQRVGPVLAGDDVEDWALVGLGRDADVSGFHPGVPQREERFGGHFSIRGLLDVIARRETLYALGTTTCETAGPADWIGTHLSECGRSTPVASVDAVSDYGDSGGPVYGIRGEHLVFHHMGNSAIICGPGLSGVPGVHLSSKYGFSFATG